MVSGVMLERLPQVATELENGQFQDIRTLAQDALMIRNWQYTTGYAGVTGLRDLQNYYSPNRGDPRYMVSPSLNRWPQLGKRKSTFRT